jgi:hypothetical protein
LVDLLARLQGSALLLRYESFVKAPEEFVTRVVRSIGEDIGEASFDFLRERELDLDVNHTLAGSLVRLQQGAVPIRLDDEWVGAMKNRQRQAVTLLTHPLLRKYGYGQE